MSKTAQTVFQAIGKVAYWSFAIVFTLTALGMSFISDGPVPLSVHIMMPVMVLVAFIVPPFILRRMKTGVSQPAFGHNQNKVLVGLILAYLGLMLVSVTLGNR